MNKHPLQEFLDKIIEEPAPEFFVYDDLDRALLEWCKWRKETYGF